MNPNDSGKWPDMSKLLKGSANLEESISMYENRGDGDSAISFDVPDSQLAVASNVYSNYTPRSMDSSAAADQSEEDTDDEDDDEILNWVAKGMLPANMETTLALNQAYQEILEQCCRRVESILVQVRERYRAIQIIIDKKCNNDSRSRTAKVPAKLYMFPYFRDSADMCPPLNEETKRKLDEMDDFNFLAEPPLKWSKSERQTLVKAVKTSVMRQKVKPLLNKKELFNEKLNSAKNKTQRKDFTDEINKLDKEHDRLIKSKASELSSVDDVNDVDWNEISITDFDGTRTAIECRLMWINELAPNLNQDQTWSKEETRKLKRLAVANSVRNWDEIAAKLNTGRSPFQCAEKYHSEINDSLTRRNWTPDEDACLRDGVDKVRQGDYIPWDQVLLFLDGRTRMQCQTRWNRSVNPDLNHGRWDVDEDMCLMKAVDRYGIKDWSKIALCVKTRSDGQCRERWCTALNENVKIERWTPHDDATLLVGVNTFGVGNWAKIRELLPGRTGHMCKCRYKLLKSKNATSLAKIKLEDSSTEMSATIARRAYQKERKEFVRRCYLNENGRLPSVSQPLQNDVSAFIKTLPSEIQKVVSQKLVSIQATYGVVSFRQDAQAARIKSATNKNNENDKSIQQVPVSDHDDYDNTTGRLKLATTTAYDQERLKKVDKEIMTLLLNSTWPPVCAYPFARHHSKEENMRKTLIECLSDKKILPPTKSTLLGFNGLLLERQDLVNNCEQLNTVDPLVKTSDAVLSNYFADKEKLQNNSNLGEKEKHANHKILNPATDDLVPTPVAESVVNNPSFKLAESIFRSIFLWPAIMSSMDDANKFSATKTSGADA